MKNGLLGKCEHKSFKMFEQRPSGLSGEDRLIEAVLWGSQCLYKTLQCPTPETVTQVLTSGDIQDIRTNYVVTLLRLYIF